MTFPNPVSGIQVGDSRRPIHFTFGDSKSAGF
jgi:hypothetical protein